MSETGRCGCQGYRSNGVYQTFLQGVFGGPCGSGNPHYLMCSECRDRYLAEGRAPSLRSHSDEATGLQGIERTLPYARLLLMAPDLLGSVESAFEHSMLFLI